MDKLDYSIQYVQLFSFITLLSRSVVFFFFFSFFPAASLKLEAE